MARKKRKQKRKRKPKQEPYPGWMWMVFGLAIGLSVAFAIFLKYRDLLQPPPAVAGQPASLAEPMAAEPAPVADSVQPAAAEAEEEPRFNFYELLPSFEVVVPEEESAVSGDVEGPAIEDPGIYVLQAGSFADAADADRRRAELALLGIESRIQRVIIDNRAYHRVLIGPNSDLDELNRIHSRLRAARIDAFTIRLGD